MGQPGSGFLVNLDHEQRVRYYQWWRKYLLIKRTTAAAGVLYVACWILALGQSPFYAVGMAFRKPLVFALFGSAIWLTLLECPRCGESFRGWFRSEVAAYIGDECQNCGLSGTQLSAIAKPTS